MASTYSLDFNGSTGKVTHDTSEPTGDFTIAFWAKPTNVNNNQYVWQGGLAGGGANNKRAVILGFQDGYFNLFTDGYPTGTAADSQIAATAGSWQHVAWTFTGGTLKGYLNGTEVYSISATINPGGVIVLRVMGSSNSADWYAGLLDDLATWSSALSGANIAALADGSSEPGDFPSGLCGWWPLEEGTGTTTSDAASSNDGTLVGGVSWSSDVPSALSGGGGAKAGAIYHAMLGGGMPL